MRSLFWCSAAFLVAGCGAARHAPDPFAYARSAPFAIRQEGVVATSSWGAIRALSFAGAGGARVEAYVVAPRAPGRYPAALYLHGSGGTRFDLVGEAAVLARRGAVTMTITYPSDTATYRPIVVDARRALDLLDARADVDPKRIGVFGFSLGGQIAAILAGDDPRPVSVGIAGGRGTDVTLYWIRRAHARLFFQAGEHDPVVPHDQLLALMHAAPGHPRVRWYPIGHELTPALDRDEADFQASALGIGR